MPEESYPNEQALVEKILERRKLKAPPISADKMKTFKAKVGEEIQRTGTLSQEYVDQLLHELRNGLDVNAKTVGCINH